MFWYCEKSVFILAKRIFAKVKLGWEYCDRDSSILHWTNTCESNRKKAPVTCPVHCLAQTVSALGA